MHLLFAGILVIIVILAAKLFRCSCGCGCWRLTPCVKVNGVCCCAACVTSESMRVNATREVTLYSTETCPHCVVMKPVWARVKQATTGSGIIFIEIDQTKVKTPGINGVPTIRMIDERGHAREYEGPPDFQQLRNWVVSTN